MKGLVRMGRKWSGTDWMCGVTCRRTFGPMAVMVAVAGALVSLSHGHSHGAEPVLGLRLSLPPASAPVPSSLHMRDIEPRTEAGARMAEEAVSVVAASDASADPPEAVEAADTMEKLLGREDDVPLPSADDGGPLADDWRVRVRFQFGAGLEDGELATGRRTLAGSELEPDLYQRLQLYSFGDGVLSSRDFGFRGLMTHVSGTFRIDNNNAELPTTSVPSRYHSGFVGTRVIRSAYAHAEGVSRRPTWRNIYLRAGRQYRYHPAVVHFDGAAVGYAASVAEVGAFVGRVVDMESGENELDNRVPNDIALERLVFRDDDGTVLGLHARTDVHALVDWVPLAVEGSVMRFDGKVHARSTATIRWPQRWRMRVGLHRYQSALARQFFAARWQISPISLASMRVDMHTENSWVYDLFDANAAGADNPEDPRRFLDLGPRRRRIALEVRGGTVLVDNIDLWLRGRIAVPCEPRCYRGVAEGEYEYVEGTAALDVRLRGTVTLGSAVSLRRHGRRRLAYDVATDAVDMRGEADGIPLERQWLGPLWFAEGQASARYSFGPRSFDAVAEVYGRYYNTPPLYRDLALGVGEGVGYDRVDLRGGGRFAIEGWAGEHVRLRGEYDITSRVVYAPEVFSFKSLRLIAEGRL